jgi:hypothetical protein
MSSDFPKYMIITDGKRQWLPLRQAGVAWDNGWARVEMGSFVLEADGSERPITDSERAEIQDIADDYSASK